MMSLSKGTLINDAIGFWLLFAKDEWSCWACNGTDRIQAKHERVNRVNNDGVTFFRFGLLVTRSPHDPLSPCLLT